MSQHITSTQIITIFSSYDHPLLNYGDTKAKEKEEPDSVLHYF